MDIIASNLPDPYFPFYCLGMFFLYEAVKLYRTWSKNRYEPIDKA